MPRLPPSRFRAQWLQSLQQTDVCVVPEPWSVWNVRKMFCLPRYGMPCPRAEQLCLIMNGWYWPLSCWVSCGFSWVRTEAKSQSLCQHANSHNTQSAWMSCPVCRNHLKKGRLPIWSWGFFERYWCAKSFWVHIFCKTQKKYMYMLSNSSRAKKVLF